MPNSLLNNSNYRSWARDASSKLRSEGVWRHVDGTAYQPDPSTHPFEFEKYMEKRDKASGILFSLLEDGQKNHVASFQNDPKAMWNMLEAAHTTHKPGMRFSAYDDLFSIRLRPDEKLADLITRVGDACSIIQEQRDSSFTLKTLDEELFSMTLIRALPEAYTSVKDALMILDDLKPSTVSEALRNRSKNDEKRAENDNTAATMAMAAATPPKCVLCEGVHVVDACPNLHRAQQTARQPWKPRTNGQNRNNNGNNSGNRNQGASAASSSSSSSSPAESAGKAANVRSTSPSDPASAYTPDADEEWLSDTGATSHMTPHRHWFRNYRSHRVPITLADGTTIHSEGMGEVRFRPEVDGKQVRDVEFTSVLHVPQLSNNLLSVLQLTKLHNFVAIVDSKQIRYNRNGTTWFTATVARNSPAAFLDGYVLPANESAFLSSSISTLSQDLDLWHRRFAHHSVDTLRTMAKSGFVQGIRLDWQTKPDPICEPCLAGKMHANPFPARDSSARSKEPLGIIHSDLHQMKVRSRKGHQYWITFIDECTELRVVVFLKRKSDAFEAFKTFKAYAENALNCRIKRFHDDKGGEYMSNSFRTFLEQSGIQHTHSTRNRPQQNGIAERANRTIDEHATAMLAQANMPASFKADAVAAYVHVWNRTLTSNSDKTPYERWFGKQPDVSHLRIWGCTSYVHIQRDKRTGIGSHMEKAIFIGYPSEYKAWEFYNPITRKEIVCERAEFDERYFPGLSLSANRNVPASPSQYVELPTTGDDSDDDATTANFPNPPTPLHTPPQSPPGTPAPPPPRSPFPSPYVPIAHRLQRERRPPGEW